MSAGFRRESVKEREKIEGNFKMNLKGMECEKMDYTLCQATDISAPIVKIQEHTNKCNIYNTQFFISKTLELLRDLPFLVGHPQGVYNSICSKRGLQINKVGQNCTKIVCCLDIGTVL